MARLSDTNNPGVKATLGQVEENRGGKFSGTDRGFDGSHSTPGQVAGNPGTEFPWDGADATDIGATTALPPLKSL